MSGREIRLAALDMDGTLLNSAHEITPYTQEVIRRAHRAGKLIALATGRCLSEITRLARLMEGVRYLISENGACLYDLQAGRTLRSVAFPREISDWVMDVSRREDVIAQLCTGGQSYMRFEREGDMGPYHLSEFRRVYLAGSEFLPDLFERMTEPMKDGIEKACLYFTNEKDRDRRMAEAAAKGLMVAESQGVGFEITMPGATKAQGLIDLCALLGVDIHESMAVGDGDNDVELLQAAGLAVAMGNALDGVRAIADAVAEDNDHDGAAKAIERYMRV